MRKRVLLTVGLLFFLACSMCILLVWPVSLDETVWSVQEWWSPHWAAAPRESVTRGDVKISVVTAMKGSTQCSTISNATINLLQPEVHTEEMMHIFLRIENIGTQPIQLRAWGKDQRDTATHTRLTDDAGRLSPRVYLHIADINWENGRPVPKDSPLETIEPGGKVEDVQRFKNISSKATYLRLELAASRFGSSGRAKFQIPKDMITIEKAKDD
jgi:hypothetical protein